MLYFKWLNWLQNRQVLMNCLKIFKNNLRPHPSFNCETRSRKINTQVSLSPLVIQGQGHSRKYHTLEETIQTMVGWSSSHILTVKPRVESGLPLIMTDNLTIRFIKLVMIINLYLLKCSIKLISSYQPKLQTVKRRLVDKTLIRYCLMHKRHSKKL